MVLVVTCGIYLVGYLSSWGLGRKFSFLPNRSTGSAVRPQKECSVVSRQFAAGFLKYLEGSLQSGHVGAIPLANGGDQAGEIFLCRQDRAIAFNSKSSALFSSLTAST